MSLALSKIAGNMIETRTWLDLPQRWVKVGIMVQLALMSKYPASEPLCAKSPFALKGCLEISQRTFSVDQVDSTYQSKPGERNGGFKRRLQ